MVNARSLTTAAVALVVVGSTLGFLSAVPEPVDAASWSIDVVYDEEFAAPATAIAIDSDGSPHVVYYADGLRYSRFDGRGWSRELLYGAAEEGRPGSLDIAIDDGDNVRISFYDDGDDSLLYARSAGRGFDVETVEPGRSSPVGTQNSIAIEPSGRPHIAYAGQGGVKYAVMGANGWLGDAVAPDLGITRYMDNGISIDVASDGTPHVAHYDPNGRELEYARWDGRSWIHETVDDDGDVGHHVSMALDSDDDAHVAYSEVSTTGTEYETALKYARWTGRSWTTTTVDPEGGRWVSIALDAEGTPHVSYAVRQSSNAGTLKYATLDDGAWTVETVATGDVLGTSIAIAPDGTVHISYVDGHEVKHAKRQVVAVPVGVCVVCDSSVGRWLAGDEDVMVHAAADDGGESYYFLSVEKGRVTEFETVESPDARTATLNVFTDEATAVEVANAADRWAAVQGAYDDGEIEIRPVGLGNRVKYGAFQVGVGIYSVGQGIVGGIASFGQGIVDGVSNVF